MSNVEWYAAVFYFPLRKFANLLPTHGEQVIKRQLLASLSHGRGLLQKQPPYVGEKEPTRSVVWVAFSVAPLVVHTVVPCLRATQAVGVKKKDLIYFAVLYSPKKLFQLCVWGVTNRQRVQPNRSYPKNKRNAHDCFSATPTSDTAKAACTPHPMVNRTLVSQRI